MTIFTTGDRGITLGTELEYGDIDTRIALPPPHKWDFRDGSICNSNGTANDPLKKLNIYGGEINTAWYSNPVLLADHIRMIISLFPKITCNFSTNLHIHARIPGLNKDLALMKSCYEYIRNNELELFKKIDPIPPVVLKEPPEAVEGEHKRFVRRRRSHQYVLPKRTYERVMESKTIEDFYTNHFTKNKKGQLQKQFYVRCGINIANVFEPTETIEFRCFTNTLDYNKILSAILFVKEFSENLVSSNRVTIDELLSRYGYVFQKFFPYNYGQDRIFQLTNVYHNKRSIVKKNYEMLISQGILTKEELYE